jgi:hypothetical protein
MVPAPVSWLCSSALASPRCRPGDASSSLMATAWTGARAATAMWLTASVRRSDSAFCSPVTSPNSPRCHRGRSCPPWRIAACLSAQNAASIGYSTLTVKPTGGDVPGRLHRSQGQCHAYGPLAPIKCGAWTSPTCLPPFVEYGCTSTW